MLCALSCGVKEVLGLLGEECPLCSEMLVMQPGPGFVFALGSRTWRVYSEASRAFPLPPVTLEPSRSPSSVCVPHEVQLGPQLRERLSVLHCELP